MPKNRERFNITLLEEDEYFHRIHDLDHKKNGKHWMQRQKTESIFSD
jgi:hypothetical protein